MVATKSGRPYHFWASGVANPHKVCRLDMRCKKLDRGKSCKIVESRAELRARLRGRAQGDKPSPNADFR